jgi:hypothetical protein
MPADHMSIDCRSVMSADKGGTLLWPQAPCTLEYLCSGFVFESDKQFVFRSKFALDSPKSDNLTTIGLFDQQFMILPISPKLE